MDLADLLRHPVSLSEATRCFEHRGRHYFFEPLCRGYVSMNADIRRAVADMARSSQPAAQYVETCSVPGFRASVAKLVEADLLVPSDCTDAARGRGGSGVPKELPFRPRKLTIFPTTSCNLRCTYCYARGGARPRNVDLGQCRAAIDFYTEQLAGSSDDPSERPSAGLSLHGGGEPTSVFSLVREIVRIFKESADARGLRSHVSVVSNGTFGPEILEWILSEKIGVSLSLDGIQEVQDRNRPFRNGRGSYELVAGNAAALVRDGREVAVRATVTGEDVIHMRSAVELARELGLASIHFEPVSICGRAEDSRVAECDPDDFAATLLDCFSKGLEYDVDVGYSGLRCLDQFLGRFCSACGDNFCLTPEGHISTCYEVLEQDDPAARVFFIGQVDRGEVRIDNGSVEHLRTRVADNMHACGSCFLRMNCAGDCLIKCFRSTGDIFGPDAERCRIAETVNKQIIAWIADGVIEPRDPNRCVTAEVRC